jgi:hypothetical protein
MAKSIQLSKRSTVYVPDISSLKLVVETINPVGLSGKIFVNQRIRNFAKNTFDDVFAAVCTPTQLEDFPEDSPVAGSGYYRTNRIELVCRTPEQLQSVFDSLLYETKKLVVDLTDMDNLSAAQVYNISANSPIVEVPPV